MASFGNFAFEGDEFGFLGWRIKWNFQLALFCVFFFARSGSNRRLEAVAGDW
jgi:hypothetical protein